jgi:hypothetical protein
MTIQIKKVATLHNGTISGSSNDDWALIITNLPDGAGDHSVKCALLIGVGPATAPDAVITGT